ncbi:alpha/beta fold hydrolase [Sphingomonas turrisvirgatae]|uniref:Hydrolase n=1 Tax=Sphingomonas turrisvirgatae TaxID=1888892 RepID=A0A1E3LX88_9SPHN|nr:alpha/beta hydrolase [Sphingomonas turrisvirgatae]ODP38343.1 hydrolase [Sphingomonas turrisvirgatae]
MKINRYAGFDDAELSWREIGDGRPVLLIHGYFSDAEVNWVKYGTAARLVAAGFRVIMPDLRAHGSSARPHDAVAYPPDALAMDAEALIAHLGLSDYDLGGYSLGARTTVRVLARGIAPRPRRVVLSGLGDEGVTDTGRRAGFFRRVLTNFGSFKHGDPEFMSQAFLKTTKGDPVALLGILDTFVDTPAEAVAAIDLPVLVVGGESDDEVGSFAELAKMLPQGRFVEIPGNHMSAVTRPELGEVIVSFLTA